MSDQYDPMKDPARHAGPEKTLVDRIIELALGAGGGAVTLLSGLLAAVLIMYSGYALFDSFATERAASSNAWDLLQFKPELLEDSETPLTGTDLEAINEDYCAWLTVYGTPIDYPVMQGPNDLYYASHDIYGNVSLTGAIYLAAANREDFSDTYNVIYGHHMDSGAMFGALDDMSGNETGVVITKDEIYDVQFFAVAVTDAYESMIYDVGNRMSSVLDFLRSGGEGGVGIGTTITYFNEDVAADCTKIVALSTCSDSQTSSRLVVFGRMTKRVIMTEVTVTKVWDDNEDQDGIRPDRLNVTLSNGDTAELTADTGWTATLTVPKYDNRGEIPYTWTEDAINGYELTGTAYDAETRTTTLTNSHTPATKSITVQKRWNDDEDRDGLRPDTVTAILSNGDTVVLTEAGNWTGTIKDLPVFSDGEEIDYAWTEEGVNGYSLRVEDNVLINTHDPATVTLSVSKIWDDNNNQDGIRPDSVTVCLYGNDVPVGSVSLSESNQWMDSISDLYVNDDGVPISYHWEEETVHGYSLNTEVNGTSTTLTNTHIPETVDLTVAKIWDDKEDQDGIRPSSLRVGLSNGSLVKLNENNGWTDTVTDLPKYENGQKIEYTWTEDDIRGYVQTGYATNGNTTVITNRHETDTTVATVIKAWEDDDNRDGIRPDCIIATLSNGESVTLSEENHWTATVNDLPLNANGQPIIYSWTEDKVEGYSCSSSVSGTITTLINAHNIDTVDLIVTKVWSDSNDQDGIRPDSILVTLKAGDEVVATRTLDESNHWSTAAEGLPQNDHGQPIAYIWTEEKPEGYELDSVTTGTETKLTNTHIPATFSLTVTKIWEDNNDQDGLRPESLEVTLSNGDKVVLSVDNDWTATIHDLPVCANGAPINYSWTEEEIDGYVSAISVSGTVTTFTNTHTPVTTSLTVSKVWDDDNDRDALRPSTLEVSMLANGTAVRSTTLNAVNRWTSTFVDLPVNDNGEEIRYTWTEEPVTGYELSTETDGTTTTLMNTHTPETVTLTVTKVWNDDDDRDGLRPETITLTLNGDDETQREVTLTAQENWTKSIELPANERGKAITYTWDETRVNRYESTQSNQGKTTTFTNTHTPATTSRRIEKIWNDADDQDGLRPNELSVTLLADGVSIGTYVLNKSNAWSCTVDDLPLYDHGVAINYTWQEEDIEHYRKTNAKTNGQITTITNTHIPATTALSVAKVWNDANNQDGIRPDVLTLNLRANGEIVGSVELNAANNWSGSIADLPVNASGSPIEYIWDEGNIEGYTPATVTNGTRTVITNTHETERTVATVVKVWDDDENRDGLRPANLTMTLSSGDTVELSAGSGWMGTIEDLPKFSDGVEIPYTWTEDEITGYEQISVIKSGTVTTITNHHDIATASVTVIKVWDDDENRDGIRPANLTVHLNNGMSAVLNSENGWAATLEDLPVYVSGGRLINYSWSEDAVEGYELTSSVESETQTTTLINVHTPSTVTLSITKVWADSNNRDGMRPTSLTVTLNADGEAVRTVDLTPANKWTAEITGLPKNADGKDINYTWTEPRIPYYNQTDITTKTDEDNLIATTITNTYMPGTVSQTVRKVWVDQSDTDRPTVLNMILTGSNGDVRMVTLSDANDWTATVTGLTRFAGGKEVQYAWLEPDIAGYTQTSVVTTGSTTVFTNTWNTEIVTPADYTLTIYYRYQDGSTAAATYTGTYREGDPYDVDSPDIPGYRPTLLSVTGTMPGRDVQYTVIYVPEGDNIMDVPEVSAGLGHVNINVGDCLE